MLGKAIITKVLFRCWCFEAKYIITVLSSLLYSGLLFM